MNRRAVWAIARKDALDVLVNKSTLVVLATPIVLAVLFALISNLLGSRSDKLLVYNPGHSGVQRVLEGAFTSPQVVEAGSVAEVREAFGANGASRKSDYTAGIAVPAEFDAALRGGGRPRIALYVNGDDVSDTTRALLVRALTEYSRAVAHPQDVALVSTSTINPPKPNPLTDLTVFYALAALVSSFMVGTSLVPGMMIEEKEKKTLRMLMVSPASWGDIILGKVSVALCYQLVLSLIVLGITRGFTGQVPLVLLFTLLGACFSVALGVLLGTLFRTTSTAGAVSGMVTFLYILPVFFVGPFAASYGDSPVAQVVRALPTYYLAEGIMAALQNSAVQAVFAVDVLVVLGSTLLLLVLASWSLRRQAAVVSAI